MKLQDDTIIAADILITLIREKIIFPEGTILKNRMDIVKRLVDKEVVMMRSNGGYVLAVHPRSLTLYDVAVIMEDPEVDPKTFSIPKGIGSDLKRSCKSLYELNIMWLRSMLIYELTK